MELLINQLANDFMLSSYFTCVKCLVIYGRRRLLSIDMRRFICDRCDKRCSIIYLHTVSLRVTSDLPLAVKNKVPHLTCLNFLND
ncbi:hypothetical protein O3M35_011194 [Rhynocoris fuscipes]|uniref:Uncharacterized protein n=1 Tax=Rhynocoris fuscipes TaxID=488301 RepID=A0AAW1CVP2_9HEMI